MGIEKNITMKQFNGTDYDTLYPKTLGSQIASTVPVNVGGTGITTNPSLLVNLGSGSASNVFQGSPRPGITGVLPVANGGTNVTSYAALAGQLSPYITSGAKWTLKLEQDFFVGPVGSGAKAEYNYDISNFCPVGSRVIIFAYSRDGYQTGYSGSSFATVGILRGNISYTAIELTSSEPSTSDGVCENTCVAEFPGYAGGKYFGTISGYSGTNVFTPVIDTEPMASGISIMVNRSAFSSGGGNHVLIKVFQYS